MIKITINALVFVLVAHCFAEFSAGTLRRGCFWETEFDPYLSASCEKLLGEVSSRNVVCMETDICAIVAAIYGVTGNIERCERRYGPNWQTHWIELKPKLQKVYKQAFEMVDSFKKSHLRVAALVQIESSAASLGFSPLSEAINGSGSETASNP